MGRPLAPIQWATGTNYAAGSNPWNGTPIKTAPAIVFFTPKVPGNAQDLNYVLNSLGAFGANAVAEWGQLPALNWKDLQLPTHSDTNWQSAAWDDLNGRWLATTWNSSGTLFQMYYLLDQASVWIPIGDATNVGSPGASYAIAAHPTNAQITIALFYASGSKIKKLDLGSSTAWTTVQALPGVSTSRGDLAYFAGGSLFVAISDDAGANGGALYTSPDGTTWTDRHTQIGATIAATNPTKWKIAQSPTLCMILPVGGTVGYLTSPDAITWTLRTFGLTAGDVPISVSYDSTNGGFVMVATTAAGGSVSYFSTTGTGSWVRGTPFASFAVTDVSALGCLWVAVTEDGTRASYTLFSVDTGATWRRAPAYLSDNLATGAGALYVRPRIHKSKTSFLQLNAKLARLSLGAGMPSALP